MNKLQIFIKNNNLAQYLTVPNYVIVFCIVTIIIIIGMLFFPNHLAAWEKYLSGFYNIFAFLGLLFTAIASLIAALAYKNSILRPKLRLGVCQYLHQGDEHRLPVNKVTNRVVLSRPLTEWFLTINNTGDVSAKFPVVQVVFEHVFFSPKQFSEWEPVLHSHGNGWYGFQWNPKDMIIYPKMPVKLPTLYFSGIGIRKDFVMVFKYAADGFPLVEHIISVKLEFGDYK